MPSVSDFGPSRVRAVLWSAGPAAFCAFVCVSAGLAQQSGIPVTPATRVGQAATQPAALAWLGSQPAPVRHRAEVVVSGDTLEVRADNSSLNQILRDISRQTGMTITGGVRDQRVYGTYGPGSSAEVLSDLLEGTGTNMLLQATPSNPFGVLTLSPRTGGPSPPSPNTAAEDIQDARATMVGAPPVVSTPVPPPVQSGPTSQVPALPFSQPAAQPAETDPFVTPQTPSPGGIVGAPTIAPATEPGTTPGPETQTTGTSDSTSGTTNPESPNGVKTPQQIYQELQKLQQQLQQQPQQAPPPPSQPQ